MNPQIYFRKKIRNIIFDTICYRFHSALDSQFDGVLFDNQERAYIKTGARLEEIPGIPAILDAWGYFTDFFNVWPRATQKLGYICTLHVLKLYLIFLFLSLSSLLLLLCPFLVDSGRMFGPVYSP